MYTICEKRTLSERVKLIRVLAPLVVRNARPGQFVMIRPDAAGERIPLTIAQADSETGTISVVFQEVGVTTYKLGALEPGDALADLVGPLGTPSHLEGIRRVCVVGGGLGCAIAYPQAAWLHKQGADVTVISGFRSRDFVFFEEEMRSVSQRFLLRTDDGSAGSRGLVTDELKGLLDSGERFDTVLAVGPLVMMKYVSLCTLSYGIRTIVSMNPIMIDGTGMCGCCRVTVGGRMMFACVDGPDFDGHAVDFDEALRRISAYQSQEQAALRDHLCRLGRDAGA